LRLLNASIAAACLLVAACGGGDLVLPQDGRPAAIEPLSGNEQSGTAGSELPQPLVAKVTDAAGRPVADVPVAFDLGPGAEGGETVPDTALTDGGGEATARWILGDDAGEQQVTAEVVGAGLDMVSFTATAEGAAAEPERLAFVVQPSDTEEDEVITPAVAVAVVDAFGAVVPLAGIEIRLELIRDKGVGRHELEGDATQATTGGVAVFPGLAPEREEKDYRLRATAPSRPELGSVDSEPFDVED
jgi:hypothetical protein